MKSGACAEGKVIMDLQIDYDDYNHVLYIKRKDAQIVNSKECEDAFIIKNYDQEENIVGIICIDPDGCGASEWAQHPERNQLPEDIVEILDNWIFNGIRAE